MHAHISSHESHWLPAYNGLIAPHPSCRECGIIKNISPDRARGTGYYMNVLSEMKECGREKLFTGVQIRLIANELKKTEDFEDAYYMTFENQKQIFVNGVRKYSNLSAGFIESFLG